MLGPNALGVLPRAEGVVLSGVYYNRASSLIAGGEASLIAGAGGVSIGRFGWADAGGSVLNARSSSSDRIGLVLNQGGDWRRVFWDETTRTWKIREGMNLTLMTGAMGAYVRLDGGGDYNAQIYADPVDGRVVAAYADGLEPTRWRLVRPRGPNGLSLITTWNNPP